MITKARASKCVSHHKACDCLEYRMQEMESALLAICNWTYAWREGIMSEDVWRECMSDIYNKCDYALGRGKG